MSPQTNRKPARGQRSTSKKHVTSLSCKPEPAIWARSTGQRSCAITIIARLSFSKSSVFEMFSDHAETQSRFEERFFTTD